jgi:hypothetical protein
VAYSGRVRGDLRLLLERARDIGLGPQVAAAIGEMDTRLRIYPQVGQPLRDLQLKPAQIWIAVFPPLVVQYVLNEALRTVMVVVPIQPLPHLGL